MVQILLEKRMGNVHPVDERGWKFINKLPPHCQFVADVKDPTNRSGRQHRFWFALAGELFANQEYYTDFDHYRACLLIQIGYFHAYQTKGGEIPVAKSLKFGKMDAEEFGALVNATLDFAEKLGWDRAELLAQTEDGYRTHGEG